MCSSDLALLVVVQVASAENWPQWRGPQNNGVSGETGLPSSWSANENLKWRVPLPGAAGSTPVVWDDRIFLTSADDEKVALVCLSTAGEELWRRPFGAEDWEIRGGEGNAASPSPVTDGEHVWAFASNGDLASYTVDGDKSWSTNLEDRYGKFDMYFVMASSPWLDGDRLYMQLIHSNGWLVLALDKHTGDEVWLHKRASDARSESEQSYASPFLYRDDEREFLLSHGADYVTAHSLVDGSELWRCGGLNPRDSYNPSLRFVASPVAVPGLIVVPSAKNGPVLGLRPDARAFARSFVIVHVVGNRRARFESQPEAVRQHDRLGPLGDAGQQLPGARGALLCGDLLNRFVFRFGWPYARAHMMGDAVGAGLQLSAPHPDAVRKIGLRRSEERRGGHECRSRGSQNH
mgnify:CR=1 FL=1